MTEYSVVQLLRSVITHPPLSVVHRRNLKNHRKVSARAHRHGKRRNVYSQNVRVLVNKTQSVVLLALLPFSTLLIVSNDTSARSASSACVIPSLLRSFLIFSAIISYMCSLFPIAPSSFLTYRIISEIIMGFIDYVFSNLWWRCLLTVSYTHLTLPTTA